MTPTPELVFSDNRAEPEPLEFLIDPFLPRKRLASLVAPGGTGKGTVWRSWVAGITNGWEVLRVKISMIRHPDDAEIGVVGISKQNIGRVATMTYRIRSLDGRETETMQARLSHVAAKKRQSVSERQA